MRWCFLLALGCIALFTRPTEAQDVEAIPQIVDADTIYIGLVKVRVSGVDAPETDQVCLDGGGQIWACGVEAKRRLEAYSRHRPWVCHLKGHDVYGRALGSCSVDGTDIGSWLVREGWALAFVRYSRHYVGDENAARETKKGLWSGAFIAPWEWRRRDAGTVVLGAFAVPTDAQRKLISPQLASTPPEPACAIKGNLRKDECIYHVPGGQYYGRLDMVSTASRRWFCSEADAQAAGCRRSKR